MRNTRRVGVAAVLLAVGLLAATGSAVGAQQVGDEVTPSVVSPVSFPSPPGPLPGTSWAIGIRTQTGGFAAGPDGDIAFVANCGGSLNPTLGLVGFGGVSGWGIPDTEQLQPGIGCGNRGVVRDEDGNVFTVLFDTEVGGVFPPMYLAGYSGLSGEMLWDPVLLEGTQAQAINYVDGKLFVLPTASGLGSPARDLLVFDALTGSLLDRWAFGGDAVRSTATAEYLIGRSVQTSSDLTWLSHSGDVISSAQLNSENRLQRISIGSDGSAYVLELPEGCAHDYTVSKVTPNTNEDSSVQQIWRQTENPVDDCGFFYVPNIAAHPDGGFVVVFQNQITFERSVARVLDDGALDWQIDLAGPVASTSLPELFVDVHGTTVIGNKRANPLSFQVLTIDVNGLVLTRSFDPGSGTDVERFNFEVDTSVPGQVYLVGQYVLGDTAPGEGSVLVAFSAPEVTWEWEATGPRFAGVEPPPPPSDGLRMFSMGDSYSSGEGLIRGESSYECGTDLHRARYHENTTLRYNRLGLPADETGCDTITGSSVLRPEVADRPAKTYENLCHRSSSAYPNLLRERLGVVDNDFDFVACSGAVYRDVALRPQYRLSPEGVNGLQHQIDELEQFVQDNDGVDVVTIGLGGNDVGFEDVIRRCLISNCSSRGFRNRVSRNVALLYPNLWSALDQIQALVGDEADVILFGYPTVIDPDQWCGVTTVEGLLISQAERDYLADSLLPDLNATLRDAAAGAGVHYIDITAATLGGEICSGEGQLVNGVRLGDDIRIPVTLGIRAIGRESFHPNEDGHEAIANLAWERFEAIVSDGLGNPSPATCGGRETTVRGVRGTRGDDVILGSSLADRILGLAGNDVICAGDGDDTVFASGGDDLVFGEDGWDLIYGNNGEDTLDGGPGEDRLYGGARNDRLFGREDDDLCVGGPGIDELVGCETERS